MKAAAKEAAAWAGLPSVRLVLLRHSKSCANLARERAPPHERGVGSKHPAARASESMRDPPLTRTGFARAERYRPVIQERLRRLGFEVAEARVGSSALLRARQTAALLFPNKELVVFRGLGELGAVPENTPAGQRYAKPSWGAFLREAAALTTGSGAHDIVAVAHGSFMKTVLETLTGKAVPRFSNMGGFMLTCRLTAAGSLSVRGVKELHYPTPADFEDRDGRDACPSRRRASVKATKKAPGRRGSGSSSRGISSRGSSSRGSSSRSSSGPPRTAVRGPPSSTHRRRRSRPPG